MILGRSCVNGWEEWTEREREREREREKAGPQWHDWRTSSKGSASCANDEHKRRSTHPSAR